MFFSSEVKQTLNVWRAIFRKSKCFLHYVFLVNFFKHLYYRLVTATLLMKGKYWWRHVLVCRLPRATIETLFSIFIEFDFCRVVRCLQHYLYPHVCVFYRCYCKHPHIIQFLPFCKIKIFRFVQNNLFILIGVKFKIKWQCVLHRRI